MLRHAIKRRGNIFEVPGSRFLAFLWWADGLQSYHDVGLTHHLLEIMFELQKVDEAVRSLTSAKNSYIKIKVNMSSIR